MLVGLPGAGKSTFSQQLVKSGKGWDRICQDEAGGRSAVDSGIGALCKDPSKKVILDRCNELKADRKHFLELAFHPTPAVCVYFDMSAADCEARVAARTDHPTIPYGRGRGAVRSKSESFQAPTEDEGFQEIIKVRDFNDANHLLALWGAETPDVSPSGFFKFPTTPHVLDLGATLTESDRLLSKSDAARFFDGSTHVVVEEKIDGANCGISLTADYELKFQNRAKHVTSAYASQWKGLEKWQAEYAGSICMLLEPEVEVLFGEWCFARHSIGYTDLPSYFVAFDIYNKREGRFCSTRERNRRLSEVGIPVVPHLAEQAFASADDLLTLLQQPSMYYDGAMEGLYLRIDEPLEQGGGLWLQRRGKVVQPGFMQTIEQDGHWIHKDLVKNGLKL
jgi:atypical dual specificity phosphatase